MLDGKIAIVTGSSRGIGKAIALSLAGKGVRVMLNARNLERLRLTESEMRDEGYDVRAIAADVSVWPDAKKLVEATMEAYGRVDFLINNAAVTTRGGIEQMVPEVIDEVMRVNFLGSAYTSKLALPYIRQAQGSIIFISSIASFHGLPFNSVYCATKNALTSLAEALRLELKSHNVHVGIAYVGFAENEPGKTILDADGRLIYLDEVKGVKRKTTGEVARFITNMVVSRRSSITIGFTGRLLNVLNRLAPALVERILWARMARIREFSGSSPDYVSGAPPLR